MAEIKNLNILDCTLRDGSYSIHHQFTGKDTAIIISALQDAGIKYIEIGHGLGLNASNSGKEQSAETDETYLKIANELLNISKFGMFFIPGIGTKKDLELAANYNMDFVRIGTDVTKAHEAEEYIKYAKDLGLFVSSNLMKSYILPPEKFAEKANMVNQFGADVVVLVDSSGGLLPQDIKKYICAMKTKEISAEIGFHGHNNFSMAIANTLEALNNGATFVDSTLTGLGRSAGNAQTEILVAVLKKMGSNLDIDEFKVMDIAENIMSPFTNKQKGIDSIAITSAYAEFHSSFLNTIYKFSKKYAVDPRRLIIKVGKYSKEDLSEELAEKFAHELYEERAALSRVFKINVPKALEISKEMWNHKLSNKEKAKILYDHLTNLSKKTGKQTVFVINISAKSDDINVVYPSIQESSSYLMASCEMSCEDQIVEICKTIDGIDYILIDDEKKKNHLFDILNTIKKSVRSSAVLTYKDNNTWVQAIDNFVASYFGNLIRFKIGIIGINDISKKLALSLTERGANVFFWDKVVENGTIDILNKVKISTCPSEIILARNENELSKHSHILIGFDRNNQINELMVKNMNQNGLIVDAIFNSIEYDAINIAKQLGIPIWRTDMKSAMAGEVTTVLRTNDMMKEMGRVFLKGIPIVSGGYMGDMGDVVVDSIVNPTEAIGIADGRGNVLYDIDNELADRIKCVDLEIMKRLICGTK